MSVAELRRVALRGGLAEPGSPEYEAACVIYNGAIHKRPAAVARCVDAEDVAAALGAAQELGLPISVRGGGHNVAGHALVEGGLTIDLSPMRRVEVDGEDRIAQAGGGCRWQDFDAACFPHGLATPGGVVGSTGIGGLTLGGGIANALGTWGFTCDNLVAAEVVTADGRVVRASEDGDADLLWGLRGGGGNFGVVTTFEYRLHDVGGIWGGMLVYPASVAREVVRCFRDLVATVPDEFTAHLLAWKDPTGDAWVSISVCHVGDGAEGARVARPLRDLPVAQDDLGPMDYLAVQAMWGESEFGRRNYWKGHFLTDLPDALVDEAVDLFDRTTLGGLLVESITGVATRVLPEASAFAGRRARFNVTGMASWEDPGEDERQIAPVRELADALAPFSLSGGGYLNYMAADEPLERVRAAFGPETFDRLRELKRRYDPENVFRLNQNVPPA
jgi:FAD/FMN-containing dehydrogenase